MRYWLACANSFMPTVAGHNKSKMQSWRRRPMTTSLLLQHIDAQS